MNNTFSSRGRTVRAPQSGNFRRTQNKSNQKESTLDNRSFVKKAAPKEEVKYVSDRKITDLPVNESIIQNLLKKGYEKPSEIQDKTIEALLKGGDLLGIAQTGTGKTAAFLVPIIQHLLNHKPAFQVLIVAPTRELALQIQDEFKSISAGLNLYSECFIGGTSVNKDRQLLRQPSHVIIGTVGRLMDLANQKALYFEDFSALVLDEFDRLLDMGFSHEIQKMVKAMTHRQQTMLFSATYENSQKALIQSILTNPLEVRVSSGNASADHVDQDIIEVKPNEDKMEVLIGMLKDEAFERVIVFAETKRGVSKVCKALNNAGIRADEIHGNKSQNYRVQALDKFKSNRIQVLVATDVAARGIDVSNVSHVINYQKPKNIDSYIHRVGRTGRAGNSGKAYTFIN